MKSLPRLAALTLVAALALSGCGGDDGGKQAEDGGTGGSSASSDGGDGDGGESGGTEDETPGPGSELSLGEAAPLEWKPKADLEGTVEVSVDRLDRTTMKDFAAFKLDKAMQQSTPYYVHVTVENTGDTDLAGVELPIFLDNGSDVLFPSARITSSFKPCPSQPLPKKFTNGKTAKLCLVFLAAEKTELEAIAMRPDEQTDPVTWTGKITKPAPDKKKSKKKKG